MGVFDYVIIKDDIIEELDTERFQTKSFPEPCMSRYMIKDGKLHHEDLCWQMVLSIDDDNNLGIEDTAKPIDYTGEVRIIGGPIDNSKIYSLTFKEGVLESIEKIE